MLEKRGFTCFLHSLFALEVSPIKRKESTFFSGLQVYKIILKKTPYVTRFFLNLYLLPKYSLTEDCEDIQCPIKLVEFVSYLDKCNSKLLNARQRIGRIMKEPHWWMFTTVGKASRTTSLFSAQ